MASASTLGIPVSASAQHSGFRRTLISAKAMNIALCVTAFALRVAFVLWKKTYVQYPGYPYPFAMEVSSIAAHLARGQGFSSPFIQNTGPTAWVAPIYPLLVSFVFRAFGIYSAASALIILILQCAMAGTTAVAIYALGKRTLGRQVGLWAAWIWAVSPFFFRWPVSWIWDFAAGALLLAALLILSLDVAEYGRRKDWMLWSGLWGIAALTNPALLSLLPFTLIYAIVGNRRSGRKWLVHSALSALPLIAIISPWAIRNYFVFSRPVFLRS